VVTVPHPPSGPELRRGFGECFRQTMAWPRLGARSLWALALTALLLVPRIGPALAACGLALFAARAIRVVRGAPVRVLEGTNGESSINPRLTPTRWVLGAFAGLCFVTPIFFMTAHQFVTWDGDLVPGYALAIAVAVGWVVGPLLMLHALGIRPAWLAGIGKTLGSAFKHPVALLATILLVPAGVLALELFLSAISYEQAYYKLVCIDMFPRTLAARHFVQPPEGVMFVVDTITDAECTRLHWSGLRRGYSLSGSFPLSLAGRLNDPHDPRGPFVHFHEWGSLRAPTPYLGFRSICVVIVMIVLLSLLELQARWLGRIAEIET
jgi:hypothetical protein